MEQGGLFCCELLPRPVDRVLWGKATRPLLSFCLQRTHGFGEGACTLIYVAIHLPRHVRRFGIRLRPVGQYTSLLWSLDRGGLLGQYASLQYGYSYILFLRALIAFHF